MMDSSDRYLLAASLGVSSHILIFINGEWHLQATPLLLSYLTSFFLCALGLLYATDNGMSWAFGESIALCGSYLAALFASIIVYRIFFHRLRQFPGPPLAKTSKLWHAWKVRNGKNHLLLDQLHQQYGDFVRTGPAELTVFHPDILTIMLDGAKNPFTKPAWYDNLKNYKGLNIIRDKTQHANRRRIWNQAFSDRSLLAYRPAINSCVDQLQELIASNEGESVPFGDYIAWFSWDLMGMFAFHKDFAMLRNASWHKLVAQMRRAMKLVAPSSPVPFGLQIAMDIPILAQVRHFKAMLQMCTQRMEERIGRSDKLPDVSEHLISYSRQNQRLEQDMKCLRGDAITLVVAGSDTAAITLVFIFYHIAKDPEIARKLQAEVDGAESPSDQSKLASLPYLNGLINEVLRLHPAVPTGGIRETPPEGIMIGDQFIPGNTVICAPRYSLARLESCFERASECIPERWYSRPDMIKNKNAYSPFSAGVFSCVGKGLALEVLRLVTVRLVSQYDVRPATPVDTWRIESDFVDQFTAATSTLNVVFTERQAKATASASTANTATSISTPPPPPTTTTTTTITTSTTTPDFAA